MARNDDQTQTMTRAGLNLIAQALSIYDGDLRLVVCNAPFQKMFNLPDALVTPGARFADTIRHLVVMGEYGDVPDIDAFIAEKVDQALAFESHYLERTRANGRAISIEGSPLPQGGWVAVYTDITRTKQQEALLRARSDALSDQVIARSEELSATNRELASMNAALEQTKRQLMESEARARLTTEMMPAHIAHVDPNGIYTYSNRRLSSVIPGRPRNIVGLHIRAALGAATFDQIETALDSAFTGQPQVVEFTDAGSTHRIRTAFTPDTRGGVYILSMDVTEETQARVALQQTHKRESAARLVSGLAHDFSNLLTIILGMQSRLGRLPDLPAQAAPLVEATLTAARRGGALLSTIADMTGPRPMQPAATHIGALLDELAVMAAPSLPEGITLSIQNDADAPPVLIDKGHVQDSLLNLILNARDACGTRGDITLSAQIVQNTWVAFTLTDTGPGFADAALARGIEPFFTTKGMEGSGLGLSMVYDMTKSAGGTLHLDNTDTGAQVTLRLPYRAAVPATSGLVLLVEDDDDLRPVIRDMLTGLDHAVIEATTAAEATTLLADVPDITLIVSDIQLRGAETGIDLARRLGTDLPLVLMTSLPPQDPMFRTGQTLAPVLRKPFDVSALQALIAPHPQAAQ